MANTELSNYDSFNRELILDLNLGAFSVYDMFHTDVDSVIRIRDYLEIPTFSLTTNTVTLYSGNNILTDGLGNPITVDRPVTTDRNSDERIENFRFVITSGQSISLGYYYDYSFKDYRFYNGSGYSYDSYLITGYDLTQDMLRNKQSIYLMVYCSRTESSYTTSGSSVVLAHQSSCKVQSQWNWSNSAAQGKWGTVFQAYRLFKNQPANPVSGDDFDYGDTVIVTKNKLRGRGRALSLYFNSDPGKDLILLGWGLEQTKNDTP